MVLFSVFGTSAIPFATADYDESLASFVDPAKDPQYYVDRYNNEPSYQKWFDANYPEYNSIYHAVGLEEPTNDAESTLDFEISIDEDQHRLLGIIDGIQTYQNTKYGFIIDFPSSLLTATNYSPSQKHFMYDGLNVESVAEFSTYPPISRIGITYHQNHANTITSDDEYLEELKQRLIDFNNSMINSLDIAPIEEQFVLSQVTEIEGYKAYQVKYTSLTLFDTNDNLEANRMLFITDIVQGDDILSIIVSNTELLPEILSSELTLISVPLEHESIIKSVDSFRFTDDNPSVKYINSDVGLEMSLPDTWTIRDYSFLSTANEFLKDTGYEDTLHESYEHLISSVKIFPNNPNHLPSNDLLNVDIGKKLDMFVDQSSSDFLAAYQESFYDSIEEFGSFECNLLAPERNKINSMSSYKGMVNCKDLETEEISQFVSHLFLTEEHFVLLTYIDNVEEEKSEYQINRDSIIQSMQIKDIMNFIDYENSNDSANDQQSYDPEPMSVCGAGTVLSDGICVIADISEDTPTQNNEDAGIGGCLIATAAYGTELAPQIQFLREVRDNTVLSTASGTAFMTGFNTIYYSFAPTVADWERENPMFQEAVRAFITPMISTLSIMSLADGGSEAEVLGLGISVIALNLGIYIIAPTIVVFKIYRYIKSR